MEQTKWEYRREYNLIYAALDELGRDGWELVAIHEGIGYFKRPALVGSLSMRDEIIADLRSEQVQ